MPAKDDAVVSLSPDPLPLTPLPGTLLKTVTFLVTSATFTVANPLTTGDTFTVKYLGDEDTNVMVPPTGLFYNPDPAQPHNVPAQAANGRVGTGEIFTLQLSIDNLPLQDTNGDSVLSTADITVSVDKRAAIEAPMVTSIGDTGVLVVAPALEPTGLAAGDVITLVHTGSTLAIGTTVELSYKGLDDLVTVRGAFGDFPLRLRETGPNTGIYTGDVIAIDGDDPRVTDDNTGALAPGGLAAGRPKIAVTDGSSIQFIYRDKSPTAEVKSGGLVNVESVPPEFTETSPADGAITNDLITELTTVISDITARVDEIKFEISQNVGSIRLTLEVNGVPEQPSSGDITVVETPIGSGVWKVLVDITKIPAVNALATTPGRVEIKWQIFAKDKAGNEGSIVERTLIVDNTPPDLLQVILGQAWDSVTSALVESRTSIQLVFDRPMDGASIQTTDFLVDGVVPEDKDHFAAVTAEPDLPFFVFLTVSELDPAATPTIQIVDTVLDAGGNGISAATVTDPVDMISPGLKATIFNAFTGTLSSVATGDIMVLVTSDEQIVGSFPTITFNICGSGVPLVCTSGAVTPTKKQILKEQREWTYDLTTLPAGRYNIGITVRDAANNGGTLGTGTGDPTAAAALDFEIDTGLAAAVTTPATGDKSEESALFLFEIDWTAENDGTEYSGDTQASVSLDKAELDGVDVLKLAAANSTGDRWTIAVPRLAVGSHTLTFNGSDALGNTMALDASVTFEVTQRLLYAMALQPGLNLISLPATPATPGINDIFGSSDVSLVFTYDPVDPRGPWLFASRTDISQPFAGDLTTIDARHAYFVSTTARVTLLVDIPVQSPVLFVPPTISVRTGWNLVPVSDITQRAFATPIAANSYLGATGWSRALTYDLNRPMGCRNPR